ncbi:MAG: hypothetical protein ACODAJ_06740, partial [Planctomycetota bacterium]
MARVRCPCGQDYEIPDDQLGERLRCRECGQMFTAAQTEPDGDHEQQETEVEASQGEPAEPPTQAVAEPEDQPSPPSSAGTVRLGDLAVERAFVSQEHIDLCVQIQSILRQQGVADKRIGEILIDKGLLKPEQVQMLLDEQAARAKADARPTQDAEAQDSPAEKPKPPPKGAARARPARLRALQILGLLAILAGGAGLVLGLWPRGGPERVLATYLESCREGTQQPKAGLAIEDPGLTLRDYTIQETGEPSVLDFGPELERFQERGEAGAWDDVAETVEMPLDKRQLLRQVLPALDGAPAPHRAQRLTITLTPVRCRLFARPDDGRFFQRGTYRVTMARLQCPTWDSGWRVATIEPAETRP